MSTLSSSSTHTRKIKKGSDYSVEQARDRWRYKLGMSKKPSRLLNGNLKHATSMPNMSSQLQVAKQPSRPAPGLPKSPGMFGGFLRDTIDRETGASQFVVWCVEAIETTGDNFKTDALYRASGNQAKVQEIAATSEHEMWGKLCKEENVNVLTGALKLYFRQLKRPLMEYSDFNRALETDDPVDETRLLVGGLPAAERKTLAFLMHHLQKVLKEQEANKMGIQGLGVVFGPTLMRLVPNSLDIGGDMKQQNRIIEFLLSECDPIFPKSSHLDAVDGSHKTATLDIARRHTDSSGSESDLGPRVESATAELVKLRRQSNSSDSGKDKKSSDDSSDSDGSVRKRNLMTTIERNRQSGGFPQSNQQAMNTARPSVTDSGKKAFEVEALYATVEKKRASNANATAQDNSSGKSKTQADDSEDDAFDLPPPPPIPADYPRVESRVPNSRARINIVAEDVEQYNIEAISYRRKSNSESSDSDDQVKYRKRVTAENRSGMIEHLPQKETITNVSNKPSEVKDHTYTHSISTINNQYRPPPALPATSPPVDSNFTLDTYTNRYKKPQSARQVGEEANKRISAVFRKAPERPDHDADVLRSGKEAGRKQKSTPVDSYQRRDNSSDSSSSDSDSDDSQHGVVGQAVVNKPTAI